MAIANFSDPIRNWRPGPIAQLLLGLVLLLLVALAFVGPGRLIAQIENERGIAPVATSQDIEVTGIKVDVTADNGEDARLKGWKLAQRLAWEKINGPKMSDAQIDAMVSAIVIQKETVGPRRYIATLGVIFDKTKAGQYIATASGVGTRSAPMLVIPVLDSGGVRQVFEVRGPWQRAWAEYQMGGSPVDYVRPSGAGGESLILNAGQTGRRSRIWWRILLDQFDAADVVIPVAHLERQWPGGPVNGTFTARYGPDNKFLGSFKLTAPDEAGVPAMLNEAIRRLDLIYRNALAEGVLEPDPTLLTEQKEFDRVMSQLRQRLIARDEEKAAAETQAPAATRPEQNTSGAEQSQVSSYVVQFASPDASAVDVALAAVRGVPGVRSASTTSIAIGGTSVMQVSMTGSLESLAGALKAKGWQVSVGSNAIRISR